MRLALLLLGLLSCLGARGANVGVLLSQPGPPYTAVYSALAENLPPHATVHLSPLEEATAALDPEEPAPPTLTVSVGVFATEAALRANRKTVLALLVSRDDLETLRARFPKSRLGGIFLDPPVERQFQLIHHALPRARTVGVLVGPDSSKSLLRLERAAAAWGLALRVERINRSTEIVAGLERLLSASDVLLAVPDNVVFNRDTALSILLTSYRLGRPVIAFSKAYVTAGALAATFTTPEDLGRQAAEWLGRPEAEPLTAPGLMPPQYFNVAINSQVARTLAPALPSQAELSRALGDGNPRP